MVQFSNNDLLQIYNRESNFLYVFNQYEEIWPGRPIKKGTSFLKYSAYNVRQKFLGDTKIDETAVSSHYFKISSGNIKTIFPGPTLNERFELTGVDEFINIRGSWNTIFYNGVNIGVSDTPIVYNEFNIVSQFLDGVSGSETAVLDTEVAYKSTDLKNIFLGPDTARNPFILEGVDEFIDLKTNWATYFKDQVIIGVLDFNIKYDNDNIVTSFINELQGSETAILDTELNYKNTDLNNVFLGPDLARNPYELTGVDEFIDLKTNWATYFNNEIIIGEIDFELNYNHNNIVTTFIGEPKGLETATSDGELNYKSSSLHLNFLGPDTARLPYEPEYNEFLYYSDNNIILNFTDPSMNGKYDQDLVYSISTISINFI